jgi:hypothetical protein
MPAARSPGAGVIEEVTEMPARITPSAGKKPDKYITDALRIELHQEALGCNGKMTKKLRLLARKLIDRAIEGDVAAAKEVIDRVEGRVPQSVTTEGDLVVRVIKFAELGPVIDETAVEVEADAVH